MLAAAIVAGILTMVVDGDRRRLASRFRRSVGRTDLAVADDDARHLARARCRKVLRAIDRRDASSGGSQWLVLGLVFGAIAFATSQYLMIKFGGEQAAAVRHSRRTKCMTFVGGMPTLAAFLAYFGAVFVTIGWWKQCDPLPLARGCGSRRFC